MEEKRDWWLGDSEENSDENRRLKSVNDNLALRGGATPGRRAAVMLSLLAGMSALGDEVTNNKRADLRNPGENNHLRPHASKRPKQEHRYVDFKKLIKKKKKKASPGFHEKNIDTLFNSCLNGVNK